MAAADLVTRVVFALERNAKTDPPEYEGYVWTDQGPGAIHPDQGIWVDSHGRPLSPLWWFDFPRDTERETLTEDDLRAAVECIEHVALSLSGKQSFDEYRRNQRSRGLYARAARLRAALDALGGHHEQRTT